MARPVLKAMKTEVALQVLEEYGVIKDVQWKADVMPSGKPRKPGWQFTNSATGDVFLEPTAKVRGIALSLQQNLNIIYDGLTGTDTASGSRVFWPGDYLPKGIYVMARDGSVERVAWDGVRVDPFQPNPLVEVVLPNYERVIREGWVRRQAKGTKSA